MKTLGNVLWHVPFMGFITAIGTFITGVIFLVTIIGAPIGLGLVQFSKFLFTPFSSAMVDKRELGQESSKAWGVFSLAIRILYFPFGLVSAVVTVFQIAALFVTIVGIPAALVLAKSLGTYFNPVNKVCVPKSVAEELERRKAAAAVSGHLD